MCSDLDLPMRLTINRVGGMVIEYLHVGHLWSSTLQGGYMILLLRKQDDLFLSPDTSDMP